MEYKRLQLISEGKTKKVWETQDSRRVILEFKDAGITFHGNRFINFDGKGKISCKISSILMRLLEDSGIATHFEKELSETEMVVRKIKMIPIEVVVRNYAAGRMCDRLEIPYQTKLKAPVLEFCYKNDRLGDPVINEYHAYAMGLCSPEDLANMCYTASKINKVLVDALQPLGIVLADFKMEFGKDGARLLVADEITPTTARMWNKKTMAKFQDEEYDIKREYEIICDKLQKLEI